MPKNSAADPSIRACAERLMIEAMADVEDMIVRGFSLYVARDKAIEIRADQWVATYGKDAADAAVRGLYMLERSDFLEPETARYLRKRDAETARINLRLNHPDRDTWINRLSIWLTGMPWALGVVLAVGVILASGMPSPALAGSGQHVDPRWRALAACGVSKPGPGRDRACRRFNSADRETWRAYDGPGAGAPRDYELPRDWEIQP